MDAARKAEIVAAIVKQFEATGLRPARGEYRQLVGAQWCACAVGVWGACDSNGVTEMSYRFNLGMDTIAGVHRGFDGHDPSCRWGRVSPSELDGYDIGSAAWGAVKHLAVEVPQ